MKFRDIIQKHLLKESRSREISLDKAKEVLNKECSYWDKSYAFYRGSSSNYKYGLINPRNYSRSASNTKNYCNLIVSNDRSWNGYPKRNKSVVGSTNKDEARYYQKGGFFYHVIPFSYGKVGISPEQDFWMFPKLKKLLGAVIDDINLTIEYIFYYADELNLGPRISSNIDFKSLRKYMINLDHAAAEKVLKAAIEEPNSDRYRNKLVKNWKKSVTNLYDYVVSLLDPNLNQFKSVPANTNKLQSAGNKEVWTDAECLLVRNDVIDTIV